jgi:hypothetical protein
MSRPVIPSDNFLVHIGTQWHAVASSSAQLAGDDWKTADGRQEERMPTYYVYLLDLKDRVVSRSEIDCPDDAAAVMTARAILSIQSHYPSAEVWERGRRLEKIRRADAPMGKTR